MRFARDNPDRDRAFTFEESCAYPKQVCPSCGIQREWWVFYRDQEDGLFRLCVGFCYPCELHPK